MARENVAQGVCSKGSGHGRYVLSMQTKLLYSEELGFLRWTCIIEAH
jgi:hypothetical protein